VYLRWDAISHGKTWLLALIEKSEYIWNCNHSITRHALGNYDVIFCTKTRVTIVSETSKASPWKIHRGRLRRETDILHVKYYPEHIRTLEKRTVHVLDIAHTPRMPRVYTLNRTVFFALPLLFFSVCFFCIFFYMINRAFIGNSEFFTVCVGTSIYLQFKCRERRTTPTYVARVDA